MTSKNDWYVVNKHTGEIKDIPDVSTANEVIKEQEEQFRREHQGPYRNFYQVNRKFFKMFEDLIRNNPSAALLFQFLLNEMDGLNTVICTSKVLCECLEYSPATLSRSVKYLKGNGYIDVQKIGTTYIYVVNPELCWSSWSKNLPYCPYASSIVITPSKKRKNLFRRMISILSLKENTSD